MVGIVGGTKYDEFINKDLRGKKMIKKYKLNLGSRGGYIKECKRNCYGSCIPYVTFSATNKEKESLNRLYEEIQKLIVRKLTILTSTNKTFIALIDEEKLKYLLNNIELNHHVIYF